MWPRQQPDTGLRQTHSSHTYSQFTLCSPGVGGCGLWEEVNPHRKPGRFKQRAADSKHTKHFTDKTKNIFITCNSLRLKQLKLKQ